MCILIVTLSRTVLAGMYADLMEWWQLNMRNSQQQAKSNQDIWIQVSACVFASISLIVGI
jgi:type II secretory pathway component PulK